MLLYSKSLHDQIASVSFFSFGAGVAGQASPVHLSICSAVNSQEFDVGGTIHVIINNQARAGQLLAAVGDIRIDARFCCFPFFAVDETSHGKSHTRRGKEVRPFVKPNGFLRCLD